MKHIIKIKEQLGTELHTRQMIEHLAASLNNGDSYLLDMSGIMQVSRSAADELYNLTHGSQHVDMINIEPFVEKMLSAVTLGRFMPRTHTSSDIPIIQCQTIESVIAQLQTN